MRAAARAKKAAALAKKIKSRSNCRFADAEARLAEILPAEFVPDESWHVLSAGDIDALSFARHVLSNSHWEYLLLSSWAVSMPAIETLQAWISQGRLRRLDTYVGEIMPRDRPRQHEQLSAVCAATGGRLLTFKNHAKLWCFISASDGLVIETSANANNNRRFEQTVITRSYDLADFYRHQFDALSDEKGNFPDWKPWQADPESPPR